ncbi:unnamed protein product [Caenorhabditis brenneri]
MTDESRNSAKLTFLLLLLAFLTLLFVGIGILRQSKTPFHTENSVNNISPEDRSNPLPEKLNSFNQKTENADESVEDTAFTSGEEVFEGSLIETNDDSFSQDNVKTLDLDDVYDYDEKPVESYIDTPSDVYPRLVSNGLFPLESSLMKDTKTSGRHYGNMKNVAVVIESTNWNDTNRWTTSLEAQRKSDNELRVYLFSDPKVTGISYDILKNWSKSRSVLPTQHINLQSTMEHVMKNKDYVISVKDHEHVSDDFADFYFVGKSVMQLDDKIESVCGSGNGIWQNSELGDLLWLSHSECKHGIMKSRRTFKFGEHTGVSIRPEVARVGSSERSVVRDNSWKVDKVDPEMMTTEHFERRLNLDLAKAEHMKKDEWDFLTTLDCSDSVYTFPYENDHDLLEYFKNINIKDLHEYNGIYPLSLGNCRTYIIPAH